MVYRIFMQQNFRVFHKNIFVAYDTHENFFYTPWFSDLEHDYKRQENVEYNQVVATTQVLENYSCARGIENCHRHVLWQ